MIRLSVGVCLLKIGARLAFSSESERDKFKHLVNYDTYIGAHSESGGHILGEESPISDYGIQSVINVLKFHIGSDHSQVTDRVSPYKDKWQ